MVHPSSTLALAPPSFALHHAGPLAAALSVPLARRPEPVDRISRALYCKYLQSIAKHKDLCWRSDKEAVDVLKRVLKKFFLKELLCSADGTGIFQYRCLFRFDNKSKMVEIQLHPRNAMGQRAAVTTTPCLDDCKVIYDNIVHFIATVARKRIQSQVPIRWQITIHNTKS